MHPCIPLRIIVTSTVLTVLPGHKYLSSPKCSCRIGRELTVLKASHTSTPQTPQLGAVNRAMSNARVHSRPALPPAAVGTASGLTFTDAPQQQTSLPVFVVEWVLSRQSVMKVPQGNGEDHSKNERGRRRRRQRIRRRCRGSETQQNRYTYRVKRNAVG